jgi:hypothetical protein
MVNASISYLQEDLEKDPSWLLPSIVRTNLMVGASMMSWLQSGQVLENPKKISNLNITQKLKVSSPCCIPEKSCLKA